MIVSLLVVAGVLVTLALPIYPTSMTAAIGGFTAMTAVAGLLGLGRRAARHELVVFLPWILAIAIGVTVGTMAGTAGSQIARDLVAYPMFIVGLVAGRAASRPEWILCAVVAMALGEAVSSVALMPAYEPGVRSTYAYFKITGGSPLLGLYALAFLGGRGLRGLRGPMWLRFPAYALLLLGLLLTLSRGMIVAAVLGVVLALAIGSRARGLVPIVVILAALLLFDDAILDIADRYFRLGQTNTIRARMRESDIVWQQFGDRPLFGAGFGSLIPSEAKLKSYVHNVFTYHLWKVGIVGSILFALPFVAMLRELRGAPVSLRGIVFGGAAAMLGYLATSAAYKGYYMVWVIGVALGASLTLVRGAIFDQRSADSERTTGPSLSGGEGKI